MHPTHAIPETENTMWGFFGTMDDLAAAAWPIAMTAIAQATHCDFHATRAFLDGRDGRHFADEVRNRIRDGAALAEAIANVTSTWTAREIGRRTARAYGIPPGMSYLTAFVVAAGIADELAEAAMPLAG